MTWRLVLFTGAMLVVSCQREVRSFHQTAESATPVRVTPGGCRCQAYLVAGDAALTDPACHLSPHHALIAGSRPGNGRIVPRRNPPHSILAASMHSPRP